MTAKNLLNSTPPYAVERTLKRLGRNLRTARLRRNLTIKRVAEKIGTGPRPVSDAEKGKPSTGVAVYIALLWGYNLLEPMDQIADPTLDEEGLAILMRGERVRARATKNLDNNF